MIRAKSYRVEIGTVVICKIIREDNATKATVVMWKAMNKVEMTNETIVGLAKTMLPEECRQFVRITEEE